MGLRPAGRVSQPLRPVLREVDWSSGTIVRDLGWEVPAAWTAGTEEDDAFGLPWLDGDRLLQPTRTAVLEISLSRWEVLRATSHASYIDVHSVAPGFSGGFLVTSTGCDAVVALDADLEYVDRRWICTGDFAARVSGVPDLRREPGDRFKPQQHHPNYAFVDGGRTWVTGFLDRAAWCLDDPAQRIEIPEGPPHDGILRDGLRWFTTVNGHVIGVRPESRERAVHLDLAAITASRRRLGWCRGLDVADGRAFVGMTQLRSSTWREVARFVVEGEAGRKLPSRVVEVDLASGSIVREVEVGNEAGGVIYGVTVVP